jgi:hypothetical protein
MRRFGCLLGLGLLMLVGSPSIAAQEATSSGAPSAPVDCVDPELLSNSLIECAELEAVAPFEEEGSDGMDSAIEASATMASDISTASDAFVLPPYCRVKVDVIFWGGRQWDELAQQLAADHSQCAEYYISIPPMDDIRTDLRFRQRFDQVRALSPRIHPVAEIRWDAPTNTGTNTGWRAWVVGGHPQWAPGRTFFGAGVEARRRMAARGLDVTAGETWALNELTEEVLEGVPGRRAEIREFLRGLYDGGPTRPDARGIVFNIGPFSNDADADVAAYKASLQEWLTDEPFWGDLDAYVDFFAHEVYASALNWGVAGVPRARRAEYLNDYFHHMTILVEEGPDTVAAARSFLRRTYVPLANAAWPSAGIGNTDLISAENMSHFLSTQVYAIRHYANAHPRGAPAGRIGFGWAPIAGDPHYSPEGRNMILTRLASAIHEAYDKGANSQMGACGPPGEHVWCAGEAEGAYLNDAWKMFAVWD